MVSSSRAGAPLLTSGTERVLEYLEAPVPYPLDLLQLILRRAHVVYHAGPGIDEGRAREVVRGLVGPGQEVRVTARNPLGKHFGGTFGLRDLQGAAR